MHFERKSKYLYHFQRVTTPYHQVFKKDIYYYPFYKIHGSAWQPVENGKNMYLLFSKYTVT